jgi:hypothetical protein
MDEYVIYRTGFPSKTLEYIKGSDWDNYVLDVPDNRCELVSRGHTITEAINLTELAHEPKENEDEI